VPEVRAASRGSTSYPRAGRASPTEHRQHDDTIAPAGPRPTGQVPLQTQGSARTGGALPVLPPGCDSRPAWDGRDGRNRSSSDCNTRPRSISSNAYRDTSAADHSRIRDVVAQSAQGQPVSVFYETRPLERLRHRGPNGVGTIGDGAVAHDFDPAAASPRPSSAAFVSMTWPAAARCRS